MPSQHKVKQGEHLHLIAQKYGFGDFHAIWDHPDNAKLKNIRKSPHVLLPGDIVQIPDKEIKVLDAETEQLHRYIYKKGEPLLLRIKIYDFAGEPVTDTECKLFIEGDKFDVKIDSEGLIEKRICIDAKNGKLVIPTLAIELPKLIGYLDPEEGKGDRRIMLS